jgi:flavin-dependent dehydrogenase
LRRRRPSRPISKKSPFSTGTFCPKARQRGTPQARHAHFLLAGGQKALEELFPGFCGDLERAGTVRTRVGLDIIFERPGFDPFPQRDLGFDAFGLSRPLLESLCRRRLMEEPNIDLRPRTRVSEILPSVDDGAAAAVRYEEAAGKPETLPADLVVDASGRAGLLAADETLQGGSRLMSSCRK